MKNSTCKFVIMLFLFIVGIQFAYRAKASSARNHEDLTSSPIPLSIEALIPRHATIVWNSVIDYGVGDEEHMAVLYSTPVIGANDSLKYIELFMVNEEGHATPRDRIYLGGRGLYVIDKVAEKKNTITVHARQHQDSDPVSNPTRHVDIIIKYGRGAITISKQYP